MLCHVSKVPLPYQNRAAFVGHAFVLRGFLNKSKEIPRSFGFLLCHLKNKKTTSALSEQWPVQDCKSKDPRESKACRMKKKHLKKARCTWDLSEWCIWIGLKEESYQKQGLLQAV